MSRGVREKVRVLDGRQQRAIRPTFKLPRVRFHVGPKHVYRRKISSLLYNIDVDNMITLIYVYIDRRTSLGQQSTVYIQQQQQQQHKRRCYFNIQNRINLHNGLLSIKMKERNENNPIEKEKEKYRFYFFL